MVADHQESGCIKRLIDSVDPRWTRKWTRDVFLLMVPLAQQHRYLDTKREHYVMGPLTDVAAVLFSFRFLVVAYLYISYH